jgi:hypothetical protein
VFHWGSAGQLKQAFSTQNYQNQYIQMTSNLKNKTVSSKFLSFIKRGKTPCKKTYVGGWWLESKLSDQLWLGFSLALANPNN